jgi:chorismate synthase
VDLAGALKYGTHDCRDILERSSARETVARVATGAIARLFLSEFGIDLLSHVIELGGIKASVEDLGFDDIRRLSRPEKSRLRCADKKAETRMCAEIDSASAKGDTLGGVFEVIVKGCPPGLGSYAQWDRRLDGILSRAVMSIPAVKAVSIGDGLASSAKRGSEVHDEIKYEKKSGKFSRPTNHAGGLEGGVTNSMDIVIRGYMKPIATLKAPIDTVNIVSKAGAKASTERSDVTAVPACGVIAESVIAFEVASAMLQKFGGDSMREVKRNYISYMDSLKEF